MPGVSREARTATLLLEEMRRRRGVRGEPRELAEILERFDIAGEGVGDGVLAPPALTPRDHVARGMKGGLVAAVGLVLVGTAVGALA